MNAVRHAPDRDESEEPTKVTPVHISPCEIARDLLKSHSRLQMLVGSAISAALIAAGYLYLRQDKAQDRQQAAEIAAASLTSEVRVTLTSILEEQRQSKAILASLYRVTPAGP